MDSSAPALCWRVEQNFPAGIRAVLYAACVRPGYPVRMSIEHRRFQRILAQRFGGCTVRLEMPPVTNAVLADISVGGMKIMIAAPHGDLQTGAAVRGEIHNENPAFHLAFEGRIAWSKQSVLAGDIKTVLGVQFADYTPLPDALMNLVEVYDD